MNLRTLLTLFLLLLGAANARADSDDDEDDDFIGYIGIGVGGGNAFSMKARFTLVPFERHSFSITASRHSTPAGNLPGDFDAGKSLFGNKSKPHSIFRDVDIMYGRLIFFPNTHSVRLNLRAGVSFGSNTYPDNFQPYEYTKSWSSGYFPGGNEPANYTYEDKTVNTTGFVFNPAIEFPLSRGFGLSCGMYANINKKAFIRGIEVNILFGRVKKEHNDYWE